MARSHLDRDEVSCSLPLDSGCGTGGNAPLRLPSPRESRSFPGRSSAKRRRPHSARASCSFPRRAPGHGPELTRMPSTSLKLNSGWTAAACAKGTVVARMARGCAHAGKVRRHERHRRDCSVQGRGCTTTPRRARCSSLGSRFRARPRTFIPDRSQIDW
jgi:hypothetical protein